HHVEVILSALLDLQAELTVLHRDVASGRCAEVHRPRLHRAFFEVAVPEQIVALRGGGAGGHAAARRRDTAALRRVGAFACAHTAARNDQERDGSNDYTRCVEPLHGAGSLARIRRLGTAPVARSRSNRATRGLSSGVAPAA